MGQPCVPGSQPPVNGTSGRLPSNVGPRSLESRALGSAIGWAAFLLIALVALSLAIRERPTAHADSAEYLLTAESLFNHGTPNVHPADLLSFGRIAVRHRARRGLRQAR